MDIDQIVLAVIAMSKAAVEYAVSLEMCSTDEGFQAAASKRYSAVEAFVSAIGVGRGPRRDAIVNRIIDSVDSH